MRIYLSGIAGVKKWLLDGAINPSDIYALESFYSMNDWEKPLLPKFKDFLLDSGAFTFMSSAQKHGSVDWLSYADKYSDFIIANKIDKFFELDIDVIKGLKYAEMLRDRIENRTGRQSIPVWHVGRGKQYFLDLCKDYKYISFGGLITDGYPIHKLERYFPWFIGQAHKNNCKIHGLGYTIPSGLPVYHFDSVDSTTWTMGGKFGQIMEFKNGTIVKHSSIINGKKVRNIKNKQDIALFNFREWVKYQYYADINL